MAVAALVVGACGTTTNGERGLSVAATASEGDQGVRGQAADELGDAPAGEVAPNEVEANGPGASAPPFRSGAASGQASTSQEAITGPQVAPTPVDGGDARPGRLPVGEGVHGVTDTTIQIGIWEADDDEVAGVLGAMAGGGEGTSGGGAKRNKTIVDYINATGGIAGREVEPVYYKFDAAEHATQSGRERQHQRMCSTWTEDHQVFAIAGGPIMMDELMNDCAAETNTPIIHSGGHPPISQRRFESMAQYWYGPSVLVADSRERAVGRFLLAHGFFDEDAKVGLMIEDTPGSREGIEQGLKPVLAQAGITPEIEIHYPDIAESPWSTYVLQLQQEGVTHVWLSTTRGGRLVPFFMMRAAEDQLYRPQWALGSEHRPATIQELRAPEEQLANAWTASFQLDRGDVPDPPPASVNGKICRELQTEAGEADGRRDYWLAICEALFFLRAGFERAEDVSPQGLAAGVAQLADTFPSTFTIDGATRFGPGYHQGPALVALVRYDRETSQFKYVSRPEPLLTD